MDRVGTAGSPSHQVTTGGGNEAGDLDVGQCEVADEDALAGLLLELKDAFSKNGDDRLARWRQSGAAFRRGHQDRKAARAGAQTDSEEKVRMRRIADLERCQDTRRKIQLSGLVVKAGLANEEPAVILGLLAAARRVLAGPHAAGSRRRRFRRRSTGAARSILERRREVFEKRREGHR